MFTKKIFNVQSILFTLVLLILFGATIPLFAQKTEELMEMTLDEILNMDVVTVSKTAQKISEAPAIIDVYTSNQIIEMGIDNLYELLSTLPGIEIMETYYGYTDVQFRGILQSHYNNKSSLLLNGQPLYDQVVSCYYLEQIPVSSIERLEVVRGPGGVLYGSNAYAGVINIITKKGKSVNSSQASFKIGTFNTRNTRFSLGKEMNGLDIFFAGEYNESNGYKKTVKWDEDDVDPGSGLLGGHSFGSRQMGYYPDDSDAYENDYFNLFSSIGYKKFALNAVYFANEKDKFGIIPTLSSTGERRLQGYGVNIRYTSNLSEGKLGLNSIVWYDQINKKERVNIYPPVIRGGGHPDDQDYGGHKTGVQLELNGSLSENVSLLGGGGFEFSHADPYYFFYSDSVLGKIQDQPANAFSIYKNTRDIWGFLQADFKALDKINIIAGSRFNSNKQAGTAFIPSMGIVYSPTENASLKILYGSGFRNPSFFEKYVRTVNILAGDENLKPEKINNIDFGIDYSFSKYLFRINGFCTKTSNMIIRKILTQTDFTSLNNEPGFGSGEMIWAKGAKYINGSDNNYKGVEISIQGVPNSYFNFRGNISYKKGRNTDGSDIMFFSPFLTNFCAVIKPSKIIKFSANIQYVGERKGNYASLYPWNTWPNAAAGGTDYTLNSYILANFIFTVCPQEFITMSLIGKNIFNNNYVYPEYIRHAIPYIPGGPGRAIYCKISFTF